jgi:endoglucanase
LRPDVALAVDVTPASDVPGGEPAASGEQALGRGVSIVQGPGIDPAVARLLREAADAEGVMHAIEVGLGQSGTDADIVGVSRAGIPSGVVSVPARYLHTPIEVVDLADVETAVRVVVAFAAQIGQLRLQPAADG